MTGRVGKDGGSIVLQNNKSAIRLRGDVLKEAVAATKARVVSGPPKLPMEKKESTK